MGIYEPAVRRHQLPEDVSQGRGSAGTQAVV